jgi:hypothetical protein
MLLPAPLTSAGALAFSPFNAIPAEGAADPDVIGILVTGWRAVGFVATESDYDVIFIVSDETEARYEREKREPQRGGTIDRRRQHQYAMARMPANAAEL